MNQLESLKNTILESGKEVRFIVANEQNGDDWQNFSKQLYRLLARCINKDAVGNELSFLLESLERSAKKLVGEDSNQKLSELYSRCDGFSNNEKIQLCFRTIGRIDGYFLKKNDATAHFVASENPKRIAVFSQVG